MPYDFSMELDGYDALFCSKLVRQAFDEASGGAIELPTFPTRLAMANRDFFERIGVDRGRHVRAGRHRGRARLRSRRGVARLPR